MMLKASKFFALLIGLLLTCSSYGQESKPLLNSLDMQFVRIPAGAIRTGPSELSGEEAVLQTGNPAAGREFRIEKDFLMCVHETRIADYRAFIEATGHAAPTGENYNIDSLRWIADFKPTEQTESGTGALPVTCVTLEDAKAFCAWLSKKEGKTYRLPTEYEWEYAARAGSSMPYIRTDEFDISINGDVRFGLARANPVEVTMDDIAATPTVGNKKKEYDNALNLDPSKSFTANAFGLYHMLGNVQELVEMTIEPGNYSLPLPGYVTWKGYKPTMVRGGSWMHHPPDCTVYRALYTCPPYSNVSIGFRIIMEIEPAQ